MNHWRFGRYLSKLILAKAFVFERDGICSKTKLNANHQFSMFHLAPDSDIHRKRKTLVGIFLSDETKRFDRNRSLNRQQRLILSFKLEVYRGFIFSMV